MFSEGSFFRTHDTAGLWKRYCGFLDLTLEEFLQIQEHLLREQIDLVADSALGEKLLQGQRPATVEEFRRGVPLTTYRDYAPYLDAKQEDCLADMDPYWIQTSAIGGTFKHIPWASRFRRVQGRNIIAALILAADPAKHRIAVAPGLKVMAILPGEPFASACLARGLAEQFPAQIMPPLDTGEKLPFRQRIDAGLRQALTSDLDFVIAMTSTLLVIGERANRIVRNGGLPTGWRRLHPRVLGCWLWNWWRPSRPLSPRQIWSPKGIIGWGADSTLFEGVIEQQWGKPLYQMYASSECGIIAMQERPRGPMALLADSVFLEFLPQEESEGSKDLRTVLLHEVQDGKLYEPVITSFYGMPLLRYRQGDLIRIHRKNGNEVPRMVFQGRADDVIDFHGIARLNTETVSRALELAGMKHGDWCLRKEHEGTKCILRLYIELGEGTEAAEFGRRFHRSLMAADRHYREAVYTMAFNPLRVTAVPQGSFSQPGQRGSNGNGNGHLNPSDTVFQELLQRVAQRS